MSFESQKIMFEIYREEGYGRRYRVVFFTELNEHNKEFEINAAMAGEHFYDGFILERDARSAKQAIDAVLRRLNDGEQLGPTDVESFLEAYTPA